MIGKETIEWLKTKRDTSKTFYIQLSYSAPHFPLQEKERWKAPYRSTVTDSSRVDFAAAMAHMDHNIGEIIKTLRVQNLEETTLIVFMSDNGAMKNWYPTDQYNGIHGPNPVLGSNVPLKDWKTSNYEGGIRVPALVYWKDALRPKLAGNYMSVIDVMPTLLHLAGTKNIPNTVEGRNIWPAFSEKDTLPEKPIYIRGHLQESLIQKPWKLIRTMQKNADPDFELYNIENDPEERKDQYSDNPEIVHKLLRLLQSEFEKDAPVNSEV